MKTKLKMQKACWFFVAAIFLMNMATAEENNMTQLKETISELTIVQPQEGEKIAISEPKNVSYGNSGDDYFSLKIGQTYDYMDEEMLIYLTGIYIAKCKNEEKCFQSQKIINLKIDYGNLSGFYSVPELGTIDVGDLYLSNLGVYAEQDIAKFRITKKYSTKKENIVLSSYSEQKEKNGNADPEKIKNELNEKLAILESSTSQTLPGEKCEGCYLDGRCINYGIRTKNGDAKYCDIDGVFKEQKSDEEKCANGYECISNTCASNRCINLVGALEKQNSLLTKIYDWLKSFFG